MHQLPEQELEGTSIKIIFFFGGGGAFLESQAEGVITLRTFWNYSPSDGASRPNRFVLTAPLL